METIREGSVVGLTYQLRDDAGELLDESGDEVFFYLHGADNIVPGLEKALLGHRAGDSVSATLQPAEAYGERMGPGPQRVGREIFPDDVELEVGAHFAAQNEAGETLVLWIAEIDGDDIYLDHNHPLAGKVLHFEVEVHSVREATEEELAHGHPHGPGGHRH
jgi:FKBP-type peptidyl-prolyl cis-trans isomerase SlyD